MIASRQIRTASPRIGTFNGRLDAQKLTWRLTGDKLAKTYDEDTPLGEIGGVICGNFPRNPALRQ